MSRKALLLEVLACVARLQAGIPEDKSLAVFLLTSTDLSPYPWKPEEKIQVEKTLKTILILMWSSLLEKKSPGSSVFWQILQQDNAIAKQLIKF